MTGGSMVTWRGAANGLRIVVVVLVLAAAVAMQFSSDRNSGSPSIGDDLNIRVDQAE